MKQVHPMKWSRCGFQGPMQMSGHLLGQEAARPLVNIPLIWMMKHTERHGLRLPEAWRVGRHINTKAPSVGMSRGFGRLIWVRAKPQVIFSSF